MSDLPKRVTIDEEGPREGFQSEKKAIPVADKVRLIEALAETGLGRIALIAAGSSIARTRRWASAAGRAGTGSPASSPTRTITTR